jgi:uncharacterized membrane protein YphA (DoxX/SURF4 family)
VRVRLHVPRFHSDPGRCELQRLFTTFPAGWPGVGLLVLRATAGATILVQAAAYLSERRNLGIGARAFAFLLIADGLCLLIGFFSPASSLVGAISTLGMALSWLPLPVWNMFHFEPSAIEMIAMCVATGLLGPGAFSLDARLFGWREITIPPVSHDPKP